MKIEFVDIPVVKDPRGNIAVVENISLPFKIKRVYYLFDVPSGGTRGGHAHKKLLQLIVPISGSFDVVLKDGKNIKVINLNNPSKGLLVPTMGWRELKNFSSSAVCLVLASEEFDEEDYIRKWDEFKNFLS